VSEHSKDKPIILAGDFNLPHIDWENNTVKTEQSSKPSSRTNRNYWRFWNGTTTTKTK
jgi:endonuclease/exonuclease/phosphatase (EEP) superfamily protein YafD